MSIKKEIDHEYTKEIVCPYCGYVFLDSWEYDSDKEDIGLLDCPECEKSFYATRIITIDYLTEKANYGTCKKCNKENVVIENYNSSIGKYKDLCIECGELERQKLLREYITSLK